MALSATHCPWCLSSTLSTPSPSSPSPASLLLVSLPPSRSRKLRSFSATCSPSSRVASSCATVELDSENAEMALEQARKAKKKKRDRRPSFYEQVQERWSVKVGSLRTKFPWQEESDREEESPDESPEKVESFVAAAGVVEERERSESVAGGFGSRSPTIAAPWDHGGGREIAYVDLDATISDSDDDLIVANKERGEYLAEKGIPFETMEELESEDELVSNGGNAAIQLPWVRGGASTEDRKRPNTRRAEATIPEAELRRLRGVSLKMKERMKVGAAGVTQSVVDHINDKWKVSEVVKIRFEGPPAMNMKRTHLLLERRTGGVVIYRSGSLVVLYRGMTYKLPCVQQYVKLPKRDEPNNLSVERDQGVVHESKALSMDRDQGVVHESKALSMDYNVELDSKASPLTGFENLCGELTDLKDIDCVLSQLGPRYNDWSGYDPVPVDADLLPHVVPGYAPPFRLLPYRVKSVLKNNQMTSIRRFARTMPPHFALGRNRQHQGLAVAMVKLWEKSSIAKIAIKRGVPNTNNERMAEELKILTGGVLISRNKDYIVFYRGNDFLPPNMKDALVDRQQLAAANQDEEEEARVRASTLVSSTERTVKGPFIAGTLAETVEAKSRWGTNMSSEEREKLMRNDLLSRQAGLIRHLETKLAQAHLKVKRAEKVLLKLRHSLDPAEVPTDLETISDEERQLFRKVGLSMKPFLCLGRRGVFDGTVENMHLHWKYRELVKVLVVGRRFLQVKHVAISLEAESGGVLISVDKTTKGYVIILYRGKNYQRPSVMRPKNLLTRRQALAQSIELQRREAISHHISELREKISLMKSQLEQMKTAGEASDEILQSPFVDVNSLDEDPQGEDEEFL